MNKLQFTRREKGYTQADVANELDLSGAWTYGKKENGITPFTLEEAVMVAKLLDITTDEVAEFMKVWVDTELYCPSCKIFKDEDGFYWNSEGINKPCIECRSELNSYYMRLRNEANV